MYRLLIRITTNHDGPGNMLSQQHIAATGWTRTYTLFATNNRLRRTTLAGVTQNYNYDTRGNMTGGLPHLTNGSGGLTGTMRFNEENRLDRVIQNANVTIYYQYDSAGQRVRKTLKNSQGTIVETRKYIGGWEVYERKAAGVVDYRRESLQVMDDQERVALVETKLSSGGAVQDQLVRHQYTNHLGTATLELDHAGAIISYEEYYPFGSTSFQSGRTAAEVSLKRYRFTGKERDEESGFYYHGARYYIPWLCRWAAVDPLEQQYSPWSSYNYGFNNPVKWTDSTGMGPDGEEPWIAPLAPVPATVDYNHFLSPPTYTTAKSNLPEVTVTDRLPEAFFLVKGDGQGDNASIVVSLKDILGYAGNGRDLILNAKKGYDVLKNASQNLGYVEKIDDGMRPLETMTMEEMATRPYTKSEGALLKEGLNDIAKGALQLGGEVMAVADIGMKGPAYGNSMTGGAFEQWHGTIMQGKTGEYGSTLIQNVEFQEAASEGYFQLADYVNATNNQSNIGFVYTTSNIIGREGVTYGYGDSTISMVDAALATNRPMSAAELAYNEKTANLDVKFAYWGQFVGDRLRIMGQFRIK